MSQHGHQHLFRKIGALRGINHRIKRQFVNFGNFVIVFQLFCSNGDVHSLIKLADFHLEGKGCDEIRIKAYALQSYAELLIDKKSVLSDEVANMKKTIALSKFEMDEAMIELKQLKETYGRNESERNR